MPAPNRSWGTLVRRTRAVNDSTSPMAIAITAISPRRTTVCDKTRSGEQNPSQYQREQPQFDGRRIFEQGKARPAVVEDHHFVDHGKLQMRGRIVEGYTRVLGKQYDEERDRREQHGNGIGYDRRGKGGGNGACAVCPHDVEETDKHDRFREGREECLPARAHALEGRTRIEGRKNEEEACETQEIEQHHDVARK